MVTVDEAVHKQLIIYIVQCSLYISEETAHFLSTASFTIIFPVRLGGPFLNVMRLSAIFNTEPLILHLDGVSYNII